MASLLSADVRRMQELLNALRQSLGQGVIPGARLMGTSEDNLYEAYLFGLVLLAARQGGYRVEIRDSADKGAGHLLLRASPGYLWNGQFTHAWLDPQTGQEPLEVHVGVVSVGASGVRHEADVMVLPSATARDCVTRHAHPLGADILIHLEAKCYNKNVDIGLSRQFVGIACDLAARFSVLVAPLMAGNAEQLARRAPLAPRIQGRALVRPRHPGESALFDELAMALRAYRTGTQYP